MYFTCMHAQNVYTSLMGTLFRYTCTLHVCMHKMFILVLWVHYSGTHVHYACTNVYTSLMGTLYRYICTLHVCMHKMFILVLWVHYSGTHVLYMYACTKCLY